ncbi:TldD/PmbA family protein [Anaeromyxobacter diazotrophicus]|uniref:Peptidase U62 n=1 Tax=Anaeromyxobacter diazotrophicus TaxID=2590199 RepID=A0A7I9VKH7_9BACT|nr:TldD/PmbA family protein [Anaeromyxobacter diazotrophicus]GEJ56688.1 peptidase U62 [Anaeromyxobacter diazotrophicus]
MSSIRYFARFGVTEALVADALSAALSRGGDFADVFFQHRVSNDLALEDGAVNRAYTTVELGVGVRVVKGDQTGYGYTEDLSPAALRACAETAAAIASGPARPAPQRFHVPSRLPDRYRLQTPWEEVRPEAKLPLLEGVNARVFAADPRVKKVSVHFRDEAGAVLVATSDGRLVEDLQPMTLLYVSCLAEQGGRREQGGYNVAGRAGFDFYAPDRVDRVVREAVARTAILFEAGPAPAGELPVVLAAGSSGILLHEAIGHGMEADFNRKNVSIYADKIGKAIAKPFVNIVDDAANEGARGAINVDDEGNAAGTTRLVEDGVLATYLHDAISAKHYGVAPTGNGRRQGYAYPPLPRMRSTYMLPGPHKREEIIQSVKKGIYCENFTNGQVNIGAGDFTFYVKNGWLIEDGKLTRPIKDVNIIGNGPKVLEQVDMVSDDLAIDEGGWTCGKDGQSVPVSQGLPTVRVASLTVGGRGNG